MSAMHNLIVTAVALEGLFSSKGIAMPEDENQRVELALAIGLDGKSQADFSRFLIDIREGDLTADALTEALAERFPTARIGHRHGKHYASYSRTGKLGSKFSIDKIGPKSKASRTKELEAKVAKLEAILEAVNDCKNIKEIRSVMNPDN